MKNKFSAFRFQLSVKKRILNFLTADSRKPTATNRGFTLLLSALVTSIVLSLGASVFGIAQKELTLSSIGRDSQFAFYAADTAAECALYWDARPKKIDGTSNTYFGTSIPDPAYTASCDGEDLSVTGRSSAYPYTILFRFEPNGYCADVSVSKSVNARQSVRTIVHADGFSTNCASVATNPRVLQRSVEIQY